MEKRYRKRHPTDIGEHRHIDGAIRETHQGGTGNRSARPQVPLVRLHAHARRHGPHRLDPVPLAVIPLRKLAHEFRFKFVGGHLGSVHWAHNLELHMRSFHTVPIAKQKASGMIAMSVPARASCL